MNEKILIIDREPDIRKTLEALLTKNGYQVKSAGESEEALRSIKSESIQLVITDMRIPGANGLEFIRQIKELNDDIEIILLTGCPNIDSIIQVMRDDGAFDLLMKPLNNIDLLIKSIEKAMQKHMLKREKGKVLKKLEKDNKELECRIKELTAELERERLVSIRHR